MFLSLRCRLAALVMASLSLFSPLSGAEAFPLRGTKAFSFGERVVDQNRLIAIAVPFGYQDYNLVIVEQIPRRRSCWLERETFPVRVNPLLLNFNFTGSCHRSTDSNGYSLRINGQDVGLAYVLKIVRRKGQLLLVAIPRDQNQPELVIGQTYGLARDYLKIFLNPGWRFTKRTYNGRTINHIYLSTNQMFL